MRRIGVRRQFLASSVAKQSFLRVLICSAFLSRTFQPSIEIFSSDREGIRGNCAVVQPFIRANVQQNK